jgi:hypothetical protein
MGNQRSIIVRIGITQIIGDLCEDIFVGGPLGRRRVIWCFLVAEIFGKPQDVSASPSGDL